MSLKGYIISRFNTIRAFCFASGWSERKIRDVLAGRQSLKREEIIFLANFLNIQSRDEFMNIFFAELTTM